ncbi:hypothetical protein [Dictyobacter formicarum]|uniref:DUF1232 domain-containing protein n=1 Tax=Dictyobacter formicarum TaxID=2778368 RepID=A0ABQ3VHZ8_9CHLR|nr:hypothetical protein [Dictyobacter formicarum]GHO85410.1 hypothetical protein KSZ_34160 [Dictyobacter formicarum]
MLQQSAEQQYPGNQLARKLAHPKRLDIFLHGFKTARLIKALMVDRRVSAFKKVLFVGSIAAIVAILLFPDAINETILSAVLPLVGTILGVPLDAGFDWIAFTLVAVNLLRYFPAEVVSEHYSRIFDK